LDDSRERASRAFTIDASGVTYSTNFVDVLNSMNYVKALIGTLTINGGAGGNQFSVQGTRGYTVLNTGGGEDTVVVGSALTTLRGNLAVHGGIATDTSSELTGDKLYFGDDTVPGMNKAYVMTATRFTLTGVYDSTSNLAGQHVSAQIDYDGFE